MKKILTLSFMLIFGFPVFANEATQDIKNTNTYVNLNIEKQPTAENSKQKITNTKSWFCINIIVNGKIKDENAQK